MLRKVTSWTGTLKLVWVAEVEQNGPRKATSAVYYGIVGELESFDPQLWRWKNGKLFAMYSAKTRREIIGNRNSLKKPVAEKWRHEMDLNFQLKWKENWKGRSQKEAGFIWSMRHQAVATNTWRAKFNPLVSLACPLCDSGTLETYLHRFFECNHSRRIWSFSFAVMHWVCKGPQSLTPMTQYSLKKCFLRSPTQLRTMSMKRVWELLRGITIWGCWILKNEVVFEGTFSSHQRVRDYV